MIEIKSIGQKPAALAAGFLAILVCGFAALAQSQSDGAAKQTILKSRHELFEGALLAPAFAKLQPVMPIDSRDCCFCAGVALTDHLRTTNSAKPSAVSRLSRSAPDVMAPRLALSATSSNNDIRVIDLEGLKKVLQRDPNDKRPLLLNFWATWCDPCREEFPDLVKLDADYKDKPLSFIAISLDDITDLNSEVPKFLTQMKATMPVVLLNVKDPEPAIKVVDPTWDGQLPATFLYDKDGKVVFKHFGKIKPDELRAAIDKEINAKH